MPSFVRLEVWTDVACASGARVAVFEPGDLASAVLKESLTGAESLAFAISRTHSSAAEIVHARVARVCWSDTALDTEWRIIDDTTQSGIGDRGVLSVECQPIALDLAAAPFVEWSSLGEPSLAISGLQLTAAEWITTYVLPAATEAGLSPITVGTIDFTNLFDLEGEFQTALQMVRAICEPGRAPGEFVLRRNGNTDYKIDILAARGSTATAVRVQTAHNLLEHTRKRSLGLMATKIVPRGNPSGITRTIAHASWKVTVVDGTHADLSDPVGGAGPIAFDDELNGLSVARQASTFASQVVSDSAVANQRITVASTAGWTTGDRVQFRRTSGSSGQRLVSLQHPTAALAPTAGGYGKITRYLDVPAQLADNNLVPNPRARAWANSANPPDDWIIDLGDVGNTTRETTITKFDTDTLRLARTKQIVTSGLDNGFIGINGIKNYKTAGLLHAMHVWVYPDLPVVVITEATAGLTSITTTTNTIVASAGSWITAGLQVGDVFNLAGHATAANNKRLGPIVTLTASTITLAAGSLTANAVGDTSFTITTANPSPTVQFAVTTEWNTTSYWRTATVIVPFGQVSALLPANQWSLIALTAVDLAAWGPVALSLQVLQPTASRTALIVAGWSLNEGADDIPDIEYPGGNVLWQRANVALASVASPVAGYTARFADLSRLDGSAWADEHPEIGGPMEVNDTDLGITTSQRMVEIGRDLLNPLASTVQLSNPQLRASEALAG